MTNADDIFSRRDAGLFMWEFCQWICKHGEFERRFYWHDILTNSELRAFMLNIDLVLKSFFDIDHF